MQISPATRICLNVIASYGRSLFSLVCGLFTSRWVLIALGAEDFGLYGLVGGMIGFVTFFNAILALAVSRFYAYEEGRRVVSAAPLQGLESCRAWFSTALFLHVVLATVLLSVGWPVAEYAVLNWLTIPPQRLQACGCVLRFSLVACYVGMVTVPFNAMYTAKQNIAELTLYSVVETVLRVVILYYMVTHPGDWLARYGLFMMLASILPNFAIAARGAWAFQECRPKLREMVNLARIRKLGQYAGWEIFGMTAWTCRQNGLPVVINEFLGPVYNSSMTIANAISGHAMALSSCLSGAFAPAVTSVHGAGDDVRMRYYATQTNKLGTIMVILFAVPVYLEMDQVLSLWLLTPPPGVGALARYILLAVTLDRLSAGHHLAISAKGKIGKYQVVTSSGIFLALPLAILFLILGLGVHAIGLALLISYALTMLLRVFEAGRLVDMRFSDWFSNVVVPVAGVLLCALASGLLSVSLCSVSVYRVFQTGIMTMVSTAISFWLWGVSREERSMLAHKLKMLVR